VRHQDNWFRRDDGRIHWFEAAPDPYPAVLKLVREFIALDQTWVFQRKTDT
jgi:hypothetical protein